MLVIVCAGVVLASLDLFIVNVALPQMARDFHVRGLGDLSWVLNAYAIVYASLLVLFGRFADRYPREQGFLVGVAVFVAASAACGAATSVEMLVAFRIVQAAGAALLTPTSLGLILATSAPERRPSAVRAWTAVGGVAAALGPVVGGLLVAASWRWVFLVNVPIGLVAIVVGWRRLPSVPGHPVARPDALGALLITGGVGALTLGLVNGGSWGWGSLTTVAVLAGAAIVLGCFAAHSARHHNPLVDRGAVPGAPVHRSVGGSAAVLGRVRRDAPLAGPVVPERLGLVGASDRPLDRPGADHGASVLVPGGGAADPPVRPRTGDRGWFDPVRGRVALVGTVCRPAPRLRGRDARRHDLDRDRRRADAANPDVDRAPPRSRPNPSPPGRRWSTCSGRSGWRSGSRC